jgi:transcriptional regulator with XRE-family HTH domain
MSISKNSKVVPDIKAMGRRIREIRGFDLTQQQFGKILGLGQTQLSKYEKGQSVPTLELLLKLKDYSGRSIDWILTGEESGKGERNAS